MKRRAEGELKRGLVSFFPPNAGGNLDEWEFRCPKWSGGCGRLHALNVDELDGELDSIEPWDTGEYSCRLTDPYGSTHGYDYAEVVEMVREEWQEYYQQQYLQEIGESEEQEKQNNQQEKIKAGVKLEERQYEKEAGGFRPVGFYKQRQEIFVCGNCSKNLAGAKRHGRAKNRNNPVFWGLEVKEKILCLECVKNFQGQMVGRKRRMLNEYLKRGYV